MRHAITLEALRVLDAIDRKGSFGAAAEALFKVPSALSYTVQKLESDLDVKLFDRTRQRSTLTSAGRLLLARGRELLSAADALEEAVRQLESGWEVQLRIAVDTVVPLPPILELINRFNELDKRVTLDLREEVLGGTWEALAHGRCDMAIGASGEPPKGQFVIHLLGEVDFVFAVAHDHPLLALDRPVTATDIAAYPTVVAGDSSLSTPARSAGLLESRQTIRVANFPAKIQAQKMGLGVGFLPRHLIRDALAAGELVEIKGSVQRPKMPLYLACPGTLEQGRALQWFVRALTEKTFAEGWL